MAKTAKESLIKPMKSAPAMLRGRSGEQLV
jgi:hypothetical protein